MHAYTYTNIKVQKLYIQDSDLSWRIRWGEAGVPEQKETSVLVFVLFNYFIGVYYK